MGFCRVKLLSAQPGGSVDPPGVFALRDIYSDSSGVCRMHDGVDTGVDGPWDI